VITACGVVAALIVLITLAASLERLSARFLTVCAATGRQRHHQQASDQTSTLLQRVGGAHTSPALHALERLQLHGNAVGIHLTTIPSAHADAHPAQSDSPAGGRRAKPDRRRGTATGRAA